MTLARSAADAIAGRSPVDLPLDEALAQPGIVAWALRIAERPALIAGAFAVGIAAAAALYAITGVRSEMAGESVMIDRDLSALRARHFHNASDRASRAVVPRPRSADGSEHDATAPAMAPTAAAVGTLATDGPIVRVAASPKSYDRVLGLADALDGCTHESYFARLACEQRARSRYCEGAAGRIPQCAEPRLRDYGQ